MNIQDALRTFYMVMHFLCFVTSKYIKNLYLYFVKMTSQNIRTYFAKLFFFSNSRRKNKKRSCHSRLWNWHYSGTIWALSVKEKSVKNKLFWAEISSWKLNDNGYFLSILFFRWTSIYVGIRCRKKHHIYYRSNLYRCVRKIISNVC